ncbi:PleD family two-component system response regulator [Actinoplanes sp. NPDC051513]|uniref:PleD family two-component system response regulator n=1 Tax=Actinoplanes sp. NPDC051513 TaxID=3363908 RepID=UPI0037A849B0
MTTDFVSALTSAPISAPPSPTILIADDDDDVRDVIAFKLQVAGYRTLSADNGRSALSLAVETRPRVVILDVTMPQLDGLSVCHELHVRPETAQIRVLMISGNGRPSDLDLGFSAGADDYLPKPFSQREMLRRVNWLLMSSGR